MGCCAGLNRPALRACVEAARRASAQRADALKVCGCDFLHFLLTFEVGRIDVGEMPLLAVPFIRHAPDRLGNMADGADAGHLQAQFIESRTGAGAEWPIIAQGPCDYFTGIELQWAEKKIIPDAAVLIGYQRA